MRCLFLPLLLVAGLALPLFAQDEAKPSLATKLEAVLNRPEYKTAHWGLLVVDAADGKLLYEKNADQLFAPASTTKLYSVAAALDVFGPEHRFVTNVVRKGELRDDGTLAGDLILVAGGDLTLGGRTLPDGTLAFKNVDHTYANGSLDGEVTEPNPLAGLLKLADQVAKAGVKRIRGDVLIDDRLFEKGESTGSGPVRVTPILVNDNMIDLKITPGEEGKPARVEWRPRAPGIEVDAQVETVAPGGTPRVGVAQPGPGRIVVRGVMPAGHKPLVRGAEVEDAAAFARSLFIGCLKQAGVKVDASPLTANRAEALPPGEAMRMLPIVASLVSPPFAEEAKLILKVSHNLHASTLPALIAVKYALRPIENAAIRQGPRTIENGMLRIGSFLRRAKVDVDRISFGGGAGGTRADYTSPRATVQLLTHMATRPDFKVYREALPILGVDGTLHDVVAADSPARGKVQAKTGTYLWQNGLNGQYLLLSKALAGYGTAASGRQYIFAFFVNGTHLSLPTETKREGKALGKLCEILHAEL